MTLYPTSNSVTIIGYLIVQQEMKGKCKASSVKGSYTKKNGSIHFKDGVVTSLPARGDLASCGLVSLQSSHQFDTPWHLTPRDVSVYIWIHLKGSKPTSSYRIGVKLYIRKTDNKLPGGSYTEEVGHDFCEVNSKSCAQYIMYRFC